MIDLEVFDSLGEEKATFLLNSVSRFTFENGDIILEARVQRKGIKWVITRSTTGSVYSRQEQDFVYDPMPSSRTDEHLQDTRFDLAEAVNILETKFNVFPVKRSE